MPLGCFCSAWAQYSPGKQRWLCRYGQVRGATYSKSQPLTKKNFKRNKRTDCYFNYFFAFQGHTFIRKSEEARRAIELEERGQDIERRDQDIERRDQRMVNG